MTTELPKGTNSVDKSSNLSKNQKKKRKANANKTKDNNAEQTAAFAVKFKLDLSKEFTPKYLLKMTFEDPLISAIGNVLDKQLGKIK